MRSAPLRTAIWLVFLLALALALRGPVWTYLEDSGMETTSALFVAAAFALGVVWTLRWLLDRLFGPSDEA